MNGRRRVGGRDGNRRGKIRRGPNRNCLVGWTGLDGHESTQQTVYTRGDYDEHISLEFLYMLDGCYV